MEAGQQRSIWWWQRMPHAFCCPMCHQAPPNPVGIYKAVLKPCTRHGHGISLHLVQVRCVCLVMRVGQSMRRCHGLRGGVGRKLHCGKPPHAFCECYAFKRVQAPKQGSGATGALARHYPLPQPTEHAQAHSCRTLLQGKILGQTLPSDRARTGLCMCARREGGTAAALGTGTGRRCMGRPHHGPLNGMRYSLVLQGDRPVAFSCLRPGLCGLDLCSDSRRRGLNITPLCIRPPICVGRGCQSPRQGHLAGSRH